jgi:hypothetical protein
MYNIKKRIVVANFAFLMFCVYKQRKEIIVEDRVDRDERELARRVRDHVEVDDADDDDAAVVVVVVVVVTVVAVVESVEDVEAVK